MPNPLFPNGALDIAPVEAECDSKMIRKLALSSLLSSFVFLPTLTQAASFGGLGSLPNGYNLVARSLSGDGSTLAGSSYTSESNEAFLWDAGSGVRLLGDVAGGNLSSIVNGVSGDGSIAVGSGSSDSGSTAFIWDAASGVRRIIDLPGGDRGIDARSAEAVSDDGSTVVGYAEQTGAVPFVWDATNGIRAIPDEAGAGGGIGGFALAVSGNGSKVVGFGFGGGPGIEDQAFIWDAVNGRRGLGDLPSVYSQALSISTDGFRVAGVRETNEGQEAFIWDETSGIRALGDLPGSSVDSQANGVSGDGSVVVGRGTTDQGETAFIWTAAHGMQPLDVLLTSLGLDLSGWQLRTAFAISTDGLTILGEGVDPMGRNVGWIAVIPEPGMAVLLGLGLAGLSSFRRPRSRPCGIEGIRTGVIGSRDVE